MEHNVKIFFNAIEEEMLRNINQFNKRKVMEFSYTQNDFKTGENNYFSIDGVTKINIGCNSGYQMRQHIEKAVEELKAKYNEKMHLVYRKNDSGNVGYPIRLSIKDWKREKLGENETLYIFPPIEIYDNCKEDVAYDAVKKNPDYEIQTKCGFNWHGTPGPRRNQTIDDLKKLLDWAVAIDVEIDHHNKVIFVNGFSANDMW